MYLRLQVWLLFEAYAVSFCLTVLSGLGLFEFCLDKRLMQVEGLVLVACTSLF